MTNIKTIYLIHHSHTDIGFTHDQPVLWELQRRFIDDAIDACELHLHHHSSHAFRWTVETVAPLIYWLENSTDRQIERFLHLEREKRIEVMGMSLNITPLMDTAELVEMFQPLDRLRREYGLTIRHAMNCDVNGQNWGLVDVLLDAGIEGFSMAINQHAGGAPLDRPNAFHWEAPSGRKLLTLNGWHYHMGNKLLNWLSWRSSRAEPNSIDYSIEEFRGHWLPVILDRVAEVNWQLPVLPIQMTHGFGDNGTADHRISDLVEQWNERDGTPQLQLATFSEWWDGVKQYADQLPTYRGDWTDFWNFGAISSAREAAMNRASRTRLMNADKLFSVVKVQSQNETLLYTADSLRQRAWNGLYLWDEHTWGSDVATSQPESEDVSSQWNHKAHYAYEARSLSLLLQRDSLAELSKLVPREENDILFLFNPLPWERTVNTAFQRHVVQPRGEGVDSSASRHHQDRQYVVPRWWLSGVKVPPFGYTIVKKDALTTEEDTRHSAIPRYRELAEIEDNFRRIRFDTTTGGVASWFDKRLKREISLSNFGAVIYERVADMSYPQPHRLLYDPVETVQEKRGWRTDWRAERWGASRLLSHKLHEISSGVEVIQTVQIEGLASPATYRIFIPNDRPEIEFSYEWMMGIHPHPEATYVSMPFAMSDSAAVRLDLGGQAIQPEVDQIPGACRDYFTVQNWVDFADEGWGVTIACAENPLVQLGDFHFGHNLQQFKLDQPLFLGWVTNNYWETNFRAYQPGRVTARYVVLPYQGTFEEARAHHFGQEIATPVIAQSTFEPAWADAQFPRDGSLLTLPQPPILVLSLLKSAENTVLVRVLNASDTLQTGLIGSGILRIQTAEQCDLFGTVEQSLSVMEGSVQITLQPRQISVYRLRLE